MRESLILTGTYRLHLQTPQKIFLRFQSIQAFSTEYTFAGTILILNVSYIVPTYSFGKSEFSN